MDHHKQQDRCDTHPKAVAVLPGGGINYVPHKQGIQDPRPAVCRLHQRQGDDKQLLAVRDGKELPHGACLLILEMGDISAIFFTNYFMME